MKKSNAKVQILVLTAVLAIAALSLMSNTWTVTAANNQSSLDAGDLMAYRWEAMGRFYLDHPNLNTVPPANDTGSLDAGDPLAYHWEAMGSFYRDHAASNQGE